MLRAVLKTSKMYGIMVNRIYIEGSTLYCTDQRRVIKFDLKESYPTGEYLYDGSGLIFNKVENEQLPIERIKETFSGEFSGVSMCSRRDAIAHYSDSGYTEGFTLDIDLVKDLPHAEYDFGVRTNSTPLAVFKTSRLTVAIMPLRHKTVDHEIMEF